MEASGISMDDLLDSLRRSGLRVTPQRLEVYRVVAVSKSHPSVVEIYEAVRRIIPSISMDTVYRTLWTLSQIGLTSPVSSSGDRVRFDSNRSPHHHFICAKCGEIRDFTSGSLDDMPIPREAGDFGDVWGAHLEIRGLCRNCRKPGRNSKRKEPEHG